MNTEVDEVGFNSLYTFMNIKDISKLPCENIGNGSKYFLAICYIMNKEYEKAEKILEEILLIAEHFMQKGLEYIKLKAVYYYASAMVKIQNHEKVMYYINLLFDEEISNMIDDSFKNQFEILVKHYNLMPQDYVDNDDSYYLPYMKTLKKVQKNNIIDQKEIENLF